MIRRALLSLLASCFPLLATAAQHPNVVIFVSDDMGWNDVGYHGSKVQTPNIDRLAKEGAQLDRFYVFPICSPTRTALMTGRSPIRFGIISPLGGSGGVPPNEHFMPKAFQAAGYQTVMVGKWHLGATGEEYSPQKRGFDHFYGFRGGVIDYYTHQGRGQLDWQRNGKTIDEKGYSTELFATEAVRMIENRDKKKPLFLYMPFNAPHGASNLDPAIRTGAQAADKYKALYPELQAQVGTEERSRKRYGSKLYQVPNRPARRLEFVGSVTAMDAAIGEVLDFIEDHGLTKDTIVIFFSDNGGGGAADNSPLRGAKGQMFEGGIRVPCIVRWPGKIPSGVTSDEFLTSLEIFPMLCAAAGAKPPVGVPLDGFDMLPVLQGKMKSPRKEMFWQRRLDKGARVDHWKWVESSRGNGLFDLRVDLSEKNDLSTKRPEILAKLKNRFQNWKKEMAEAEPRGPFRDF